MKKVLFFGIYDRSYARNVVLRHGFERNGWQVDECHVDARKNHGLKKYVKLFWLGLRAKRTSHDIVLVAFPGHSVVWLARLIFGRHILFDAFLSQYDANVIDRKLYSGNSWRGRKDKFLDTWSCRLAEWVLVDTEALKNHFVQDYGVTPEKCIPIPISADDTLFRPSASPEDEVFTVHFHGTFIPLQGVQYIVEAAHILRDEGIVFRLVGGGQDAPAIDAKIKELGLEKVIERVQKVPVTEIQRYMARAHIVLGIFGDAIRAKMAIPNKVYEAMAMGKAIITADTEGIREIPHAEKIFRLVPLADSVAMAQAILDLRSNRDKLHVLGQSARTYFAQALMSEKLVSRLLQKLTK